MDRSPLTDRMNFTNILYIGEEPKACLSALMDFSNRLNEIEFLYEDWFSGREVKGRADRLQNHIHYHFEGGLAIFKFKNEEELPYYIRKECLDACKALSEEQLYYAS
jgi:hypothetical protein